MITGTIAMSETRLSLLVRVRDLGDAASWHEFDEIYRPLIFGYLRSLGLKELDAHDLTQEVFQRLMAILPTFELDRERGRFRTYLWKLTYNDADRLGAAEEGPRPGGRGVGSAILRDDESESRELEGIFRRQHRERILEVVLPQVRATVSVDGLGVLRGRLLQGRPAADDRRRAGDHGQRRLCLRLAGLERGPAPLRRARGGTGRWLRF